MSRSEAAASGSVVRRHPNSLANLVAPFKLGQSGNPLGAGHPHHRLVRDATERAWRRPLTPALRAAFRRKGYTVPDDLRTVGEAAAFAVVHRIAAKGDAYALSVVRDTLDGRPVPTATEQPEQLGYDEERDAIECLRLAIAKGLITLDEVMATEGKLAARDDPRDYVVDTQLADDEAQEGGARP